MYDLIILGAGPAGLTAAAYALHKRLETLVITLDLGGKVNYPFRVPWMEGHELITGLEIVNRYRSKLQYLNFAHEMDRAVQVARTGKHFAVVTEKQKKFETRAIIVATGATARRLGAIGESKVMGQGLSYSAISHAPLFIDRNVALVGQGMDGLRAAAELALVAKKVHVVFPDPKDLDTPLGAKLQADPKVEVLAGYQVKEVLGEERVQGVVLAQNGTTRKVDVEGLFVELGLTANSQIVADLVNLTPDKRIVVDGRNATSCPGIFAAGDVTDTFAEQVLIAIGDGARAALSAYEYLLEQ
jgi:thioredoxin reductase